MYNRSPWPDTINDAAERIISVMNDQQKKKLKETHEIELPRLRFGLGIYMRNELGLHEGNDSLIKACIRLKDVDFESSNFLNDIDTVSDVIIETIREKLNVTHLYPSLK